MHSRLAITPGGLPLGLAGIKLWTHKKCKGTNTLKGRGPFTSSNKTPLLGDTITQSDSCTTSCRLALKPARALWFLACSLLAGNKSKKSAIKIVGPESFVGLPARPVWPLVRRLAWRGKWRRYPARRR